METYIPKHLHLWEHPDCYFGATWEGWYVAPCSTSRDADCLTRTNYEQQEAALEALNEQRGGPLEVIHGLAEECSPCAVTENHWAVGWIGVTYIHSTDYAALKVADQLAARLESYPVLNEEAFSAAEEEEANDTWRGCYNWRERIEFIREHWECDDYIRSFSDLLGAVRGQFFPGPAELIVR